MSWLEQIRTMYTYNQWANNKVLAAAAQVSDEELAAERTISSGSLSAALAHIVQAQQGWFSRFVGEPFPERWKPPAEDIIPTLRQHFDASHERLRVYSERLTEEELTERTIDIEWQGKVYSYKPWKILMHLANHGTQHRAEIGIALLALDASPGDLDLDDFYFIDQL